MNKLALPPTLHRYVASLEAQTASELTPELDVDLEAPSRQELVELIVRLLQRVRVLEARLRELERRGGGGDKGGGSGSLGAHAEALESDDQRLGQEADKKKPPRLVKANRPTGEKKERKKREPRLRPQARQADPSERTRL